MEESVYRDSLSFEAGFCLYGVSLSIGMILSFWAESVWIGIVCPFERVVSWDESVCRGRLSGRVALRRTLP